MKKIWFKIFYRQSKKNWLNILVNILGLALGFSGLIIVLLYLNDEKAYNQWNPNKTSIYKINHILSNGDVWQTSTSVEGGFFTDEIPEVTDFYLSDSWYDETLITTGSKKKFTRGILQGNPNFFDFFPFAIIQGSANHFKEVRNHMAISKKLALHLFKKENALGKTIDVRGNTYMVSTVFEGNEKSYFNPNIIIQYPKNPQGHWGNFSKNLFVKVREDASMLGVEEKMDAIFTKYSAIPGAEGEGISLEEFQELYGIKVKIDNLSDIRLHALGDTAGPEGKGNYQLIVIMLGLSILLVIISCVNFINLATASASQRAKEVGVKKTLGLSKTTLAKQYVLEVMFQGLIAFIFALVFVELLLPSFNNFLNKNISIFDNTVLLNVAILAILVSLFVGIIPAIYISNFKSVEVLKGNISRSKNGRFIRNAMLGVQFLISGFFLIGVMTIYLQVNYMMNKELGFTGEQIIVIRMNDNQKRYQKYQTLKKELIKHPKIEVITSNYFIPGNNSSNSTNAKYKDLSTQANSNAVDFEYLDMVNIKILKGRTLKEKFASDTISNIMINEAFAKALNIYDDPIGKKVYIGFDDDNIKKNVIGMIKDYHINGFEKKIDPMFLMHWNTYNHMRDYNFRSIQFKVKSENFSETIAFIEDYWKKNIEQGYPFNYSFLDKQFQQTFAKYQQQKRMFLILTLAVIFISLLGLFALATLSIQQRLKEVAIRKTLGASVKEIMFQLIKNFIQVVLIASVFLIPIAYYFMRNWLDNFAYRIDIPWLSFILAPIILIVLVIAIVGLKAYKATKIDLVKYLKFE